MRLIRFALVAIALLGACADPPSGEKFGAIINPPLPPGVTGTGTTSDLAAWSSSTALGNYAGASSCSAGSFFTGLSAAGASTCAATGLTGLTTNQSVKATGVGTIGNAWAVDNGTTWGVSGIFTINETTGVLQSVGAMSFNGISTISGNVFTPGGYEFTGTSGYLYHTLASTSGNASVALESAGTGSVDINPNVVGGGSVPNPGTGGLRIFGGGSTPTYRILGNGHLSASGTAQSSTNLTSCGTTPSILSGSTDAVGEIVEGTTATGCAMAFVATYTVAPVCTCTGETAALAAVLVGCHATATTLTVENASASNNKIYYTCSGLSGST